MRAILVSFGFASLLFSSHAEACSCKIKPSLDDALAEVEAVVHVRAVAHEGDDVDDQRAVFEVVEVLKGDVTTKKFAIRSGVGKDCLERLSSFPIDREFVLLIQDPDDTPAQPITTCGPYAHRLHTQAARAQKTLDEIRTALAAAKK